MNDTEEEASQQGAFNEETGEINWDCPCLGGMAHGPCGENFRAAFSCFVFSKAEPKGMDCIDNFKWVWPVHSFAVLYPMNMTLLQAETLNKNQNRNMQDCFRQYPEVYGGEYEDGESPEDDDLSYSNPQVDEPSIPPPLDPSLPMPAVDQPSVPLYTSKTSVDKAPLSPLESDSQASSPSSSMSDHTGTGARASSRTTEEPVSESEELVPKAWHDTNAPNGGV